MIAAIAGPASTRRFTSSLRHFLARWRAELADPLKRALGVKPTPKSRFATHYSPRRATWVLLRDEEELEDDERAFVHRLVELWPEAKNLRELARDFQALVARKCPDLLESWLSRAAESGIPESRNFTSSLRRDGPAVHAALSCEWSTGQVEGQIHRLQASEAPDVWTGEA